MSLILSGSDGLSDVDGTAAAPAIRGTDTNTGIFFPAADTIAFAEGGAEVMRITSTGSVFVKTADARIGSDVGSVEYGTSTANSVKFFSNNTEAFRIDSSGNLLVGRTTQRSTEKLGVAGASSNFISEFSNTAASGSLLGVLALYSNYSPNTTGNDFFRGADSTATRFGVYSNGGIANYSANNVNLSDRLEKMNFAPAGSYLDKICAIPVQTYNYIDQNLEEDDGLTLGVVAQDVQAVAPELVMESNWGTEDVPKMRLSIYQTDLQYALMKCIQEQQTLITALTARITALEAANV